MSDKSTIGLHWSLLSPEHAFHCVHNMKRICHEQSPDREDKERGMAGFVCDP